MDQILNNFLSVQTVIFCLIAYIITQIIRTLIEKIGNKVNLYISNKVTKYIYETWRETFLPLIPLFIGGILAYKLDSYPFPVPFNTSISARIFYGIICGGASGFVYRFIRFYIKRYLAQGGDDGSENGGVDPVKLLQNPTEPVQQLLPLKGLK